MPQQANQPLPAGYVLNGYRIEKPLSSGGFSIVYLARDEKDTPYAIKEYLPSTMPVRTDGIEVKITDEANLSVFRHGLKCFFEEGRALAMISHPNVVRVENFFRANETCYMVMQYVRGRTLQFHIQRNRHEFTETFIRRTFTHLMNGLREVHARKLLHLDIKPANIFVSMEGRPVLLDFGAARITLSEEMMKLKPMYTAGFAAPEHYRFKPEELGPWSDIYSVGATMYTCIAGTPPQAGDVREQKDRMIPVRTLASQPYSDDLYDIVESCLALDHLKRPQTAFDLQKRLMVDAPEPGKEEKPTFLETLNRPLSKLFQR
jgi:eukaryotic-like serine/threonine-protein kinase